MAMRRLGTIGCALLLATAVACGTDEASVGTGGDGGSNTTTAARSPDQRYRFSGTVLQGPTGGPQLCSFVLDSYPPQCSGGQDLDGWDWSTVRHESANGIRWGRYELIGTWDDGRFTSTELATTRAPGAASANDEPDPLPVPCDDPPVGTITEDTDAVDPAYDYVDAQDDWAGSWHVGDVYVVAFTGDIERHTRDLATRWDGPYCVTSSPRNHAELEQMMIDLAEEYGAFSSAMAPHRGGVDLTLWVDDPDVQSELDRRYGAGVVEVDGHLRPVD